MVPMVARLPWRNVLPADIKNLYIFSSQTNNHVPLMSIATVGNSLEMGSVRRREHFRTISTLCYPQPGVLASDVLSQVLPKVQEFQKNLPAGYQLGLWSKDETRRNNFSPSSAEGSLRGFLSWSS